MKAMKAMKRVSMLAKGRFAKSVVFRGTKTKTAGGLTKSDITKNSAGKFVSKAKSILAKKRYAQTIKPWNVAVAKARKELKIKGFVVLKKNTALYAKAKSFYKQ